MNEWISIFCFFVCIVIFLSSDLFVLYMHTTPTNPRKAAYKYWNKCKEIVVWSWKATLDIFICKMHYLYIIIMLIYSYTNDVAKKLLKKLFRGNMKCEFDWHRGGSETENQAHMLLKASPIARNFWEGVFWVVRGQPPLQLLQGGFATLLPSY